MKKLFAIALTAAMVMSMASVAFAADDKPNDDYKVMGLSEGYQKIDDDVMLPDAGSWNEKIPYGETVYFQLVAQNEEPVTDSDYVKSTSIKASWDMNGSAIAKVEIVKKKGSDGEYTYYLAITGKDSTTTADTDVSGKITLKKSGKYGFDEFDKTIDLTYGYYNNKNDNLVIEKDPAIWEFETGEGAEDDEFEFAEWDGAYFTVDTQGQGKIVVAADVKYNADIASKYPTANIDFFNGNGASFNKIGELFLPADVDTHIYAVNADGTLSAVKATYDEYEEGWRVKTRTLGKYLISDVELKTSVPTVTPGEDADDTVDGTVEPTVPSNPSTGARA